MNSISDYRHGIRGTQEIPLVTDEMIGAIPVSYLPSNHSEWCDLAETRELPAIEDER